MLTRRDFNLGLTSAAFGGLALAGCIDPREIPAKIARIPHYRTAQMRRFEGYGPLVPDSAGLLDLPAGFSYQTISWFGREHGDSGAYQEISGADQVPDNADGMGAFKIDDRLMVLVRNHELKAGDFLKGPFPTAGSPNLGAFDRDRQADRPLPGGTTTIIYDYRNHRLDRQYLSLSGTIRNCAGGATPWGTWLSCEEDVSQTGRRLERDHGWVFEVPALQDGLAVPSPIVDMGRFNHEAVAVDPRTGIVYMTEDQNDGLFYRFLPHRRDELCHGGVLQALAFAGSAEGLDSRNWRGHDMAIGLRWPVRWITLCDVHSPDGDDLRVRGRALGATRFACGEGIHFGMGELYFCCTSGGWIKSGQIMRYVPSPDEGEGEDKERAARATLELFLESTDPARLNFADNLTVAPNGHLIVCEDPYVGGEDVYLPRGFLAGLLGIAPCYLRGVTPTGAVYDIARLHGGSELAGVCFSPDGETMFVNIYGPAKTVAIRRDRPWANMRPGWSIPTAGLRIASCPAAPPLARRCDG